MKFIKKNKSVIIIVSVCLILLLLSSLAVYKMFNPDGNKYDRAEGAPIVDEVVIEQIKLQILDTKLASKVEYRTSLAIMKFTLSISEGAKLEDAKNLTNIIIDKLSTTVLGFYDVEVYLTKENDSSYPIIAYKSKNAESFSFVLNRGNENE